MNKDTTLPLDMPVIDWENCLMLANKKEELAKTILNIFILSLPESLDIINKNLEQLEWQLLANELHKLLGGCSYAGVPRLKWVTKEAEKTAKEQNNTLAAELIALLNIEAIKVLTEYQHNKAYQL